jgi:hypothetical protein
MKVLATVGQQVSLRSVVHVHTETNAVNYCACALLYQGLHRRMFCHTAVLTTVLLQLQLGGPTIQMTSKTLYILLAFDADLSICGSTALCWALAAFSGS